MAKCVLLLLSLATLASIPVAPTPTPTPKPGVIKTSRMTAIETKYHVRIMGIMRTPDGDFWVFLEHQENTIFPEFPVVILSTGTDHDFSVARISSENTATWYESQIKRANASPTPADGAFTMPTHPPGEVER